MFFQGIWFLRKIYKMCLGLQVKNLLYNLLYIFLSSNTVILKVAECTIWYKSLLMSCRPYCNFNIFVIWLRSSKNPLGGYAFKIIWPVLIFAMFLNLAHSPWISYFVANSKFYSTRFIPCDPCLNFILIVFERYT